MLAVEIAHEPADQHVRWNVLVSGYLLENDLALGVERLCLERGVRELRQNLQRLRQILAQHSRPVVRHLPRGCSVVLRTELFERAIDLLPGERLRLPEGHMLEEVRNTHLPSILVPGSRADPEGSSDGLHPGDLLADQLQAV